MLVRSSITITAPDPAIEPAAAVVSTAICTSRSSGIRIGADEPPGMKHFIVRPPATPPPQPSIRSRNEAVTGSS